MTTLKELLNVENTTPASDLNSLGGNYLIGGGAVVPSFSSTRFKYVGNKLTSYLFDNGSGSVAGATNINANLYFNGTASFRSRANETCATIVLNGATAATTSVFTVFADSSVAGAADSAVTTVAKFSVTSLGRCLIGDAATNDALVHQLYGSMSLLGTVIPSFTSTTVRYIGTKLTSVLFQGGAVASAGVLNNYANCYHDGTNVKYGRANETAANLFISGATTATAVAFAFAADASVSHAADIAATLVNLHTIDSAGTHAIGPATGNDAIVQQVYGSINLKGAVIPAFTSTRYRYIGTKLSSLLIDDGSGAAAGGIFAYANAYFDGTNNRRSRTNETCANIQLNGQTAAATNVYMLGMNNSVASAADSTVTFTTVHGVNANGTHTVGPSSSDAIIHQINGSVNLLGTAIPAYSSTTVRYIGTKLNSMTFVSGALGSAGRINMYANMYNDGTSALYGRANETCTNIFFTGTTTATANAFIIATDPSIAHAADAAATVVNTLSIGASGGVIDYTYNTTTPNVSWASAAFGATDSPLNVRKVDNTTGAAITKFIEVFRNCTTATTAGTAVAYVGTDIAGLAGCFASSDEKLKTNIEDFTDGIDVVKSVAARAFHWKEGARAEKSRGFIAQELLAHWPQAVVNISHDTLGVSYNALTAVLWSAVRELITRIEILEKNK